MRNTCARAVFFLIVLAGFVPAVFAGGGREAAELVTPAEAHKLVQDGEAIIVDVRDRQSYVLGHIEGALNFPLSSVSANAARIAEYGKTVITYCSCPAEESSLAAAGDLVASGFTDVLVMKGGIAAWADEGLPVRPGDRP